MKTKEPKEDNPISSSQTEVITLSEEELEELEHQGKTITVRLAIKHQTEEIEIIIKKETLEERYS